MAWYTSLDEQLKALRKDIWDLQEGQEPTPPTPGPEPPEPTPPTPTPPTPTPTPTPAEKIGFGESRHSFAPGECRIWEIVLTEHLKKFHLQVHNTSVPHQKRTVHLLVAKNRKPTIAEFMKTWFMSPSQYDRRLKMWIPAKPGAEHLYWRYNTGSAAELIQVKDLPIDGDKYYIMLYNPGYYDRRKKIFILGDKSVKNQRLIVAVF